MPVDDDLGDAYFLYLHPGWSYPQLQDAPEEIVTLMHEIRGVHARIAELDK